MPVEALDLQPRKWPRQGRSRATFDALLDATARVLVERGYAALTTNAVAERAGASVGSLYEYFGNKDTLVAVLIEREAGAVLVALEASMERASALALEEAMRVWLDEMFAELEARRDLVRVLIMEVPYVGRLPIVSSLPLLLERIAATGGHHRRHEVALGDRPAVFYLMANMLRGAYVAMLLRPPAGVDRAALLDDMTELVLRMLVERPA